MCADVEALHSPLRDLAASGRVLSGHDVVVHGREWLPGWPALHLAPARRWAARVVTVSGRAG
jgi:hypothetical protein